MKISPVFTNFIATDNLLIDNSSIIEYTFKLRESDPGRIISNEGGWQSNNIDISKIPELFDIYKEISKRLDELHFYFELKNNLKTRITDSWININGNNHYNTPHDHGSGLFSGIYYVKADGDCGNVEFMTPIGAHTFSINGNFVKTFNPFNSNIQTVKVQTGLLVLFPSWLVHYTRPNKTDQNRISIAFNSYIV
jgi:uncharacterized protein (TIGR02466 family)